MSKTEIMAIKRILIVLCLTTLFPVLFYQKQIGVNLLLYNALLLIGTSLVGKLDLRYRFSLIVVLGTWLSAIFVVVNGSVFSVAINILSLFLFAGITLFPQSRNLLNSSVISIIAFFSSQLDFFNNLQISASGNKIMLSIIRFVKIVIVPVIVVFVFVLIYKAANPVFEGMMSSFFNFLGRINSWIVDNIGLSLLFTIIFGMALSNYFILGKANTSMVNLDSGSKVDMVRLRRKSSIKRKFTALKSEYKSAVLLFIMLNVLLLIINVIDVYWVWFNFEWNGEYLKQFVHEGTYLLILSIIISLFISIFYFRGNINFFKNNKLLKILAYIWLSQNAILVFSVAIRNFWYINYFSLAYLRIGVIFFLILTLYSIYSVFIKIKNRKTTYYLFSRNSMVIYMLLIVMSLINWDVIIAKYNFSHSETAFVHFDFLSNLSDNALPYLDKNEEELLLMDNYQKQEFDFRKQYMNSSDYKKKVEKRKEDFIDSWAKSSWQEWNMAGESAYRKMLE